MQRNACRDTGRGRKSDHTGLLPRPRHGKLCRCTLFFVGLGATFSPIPVLLPPPDTSSTHELIRVDLVITKYAQDAYDTTARVSRSGEDDINVENCEVIRETAKEATPVTTTNETTFVKRRQQASYRFDIPKVEGVEVTNINVAKQKKNSGIVLGSFFNLLKIKEQCWDRGLTFTGSGFS
ncbi:hypothetical protein BGZ83_003841 [Gryganskiella cystojenkinii]|nr:hypothetical protein BGZ83_003841 [Gryganskiella cystojenkinii]